MDIRDIHEMKLSGFGVWLNLEVEGKRGVQGWSILKFLVSVLKILQGLGVQHEKKHNPLEAYPQSYSEKENCFQSLFAMA